MGQWDDPENQQSMLSLFQVDIENLVNVQFGLMYHLRVSPSEVNNWPYWEYEIYVERLAEVLKKKQQAEDKQGKEMNQQQFNPQKSADGFLKKAQGAAPKVSMPSFRMPK